MFFSSLGIAEKCCGQR